MGSGEGEEEGDTVTTYLCKHCGNVFDFVAGTIPPACPYCGSLYFIRTGGK